ncbi:M56 family metallopeptidase [Candidatus Palauibacter sp.]|uniref:M56 family metallopeptidase n=1 Tax=Candidatus Palauibacter sp. TaxID=3101350 RepID=UPI003B0214DF
MTGLLVAAAPGAAGLTGRVTLLLLLALALAWLGRRGSPGTLHLLWTTTFALVLALPLLSFLVPSWNVPILSAPHSDPHLPAVETAVAATRPAVAAVEVRGPEIVNPGAVPGPAEVGQPRPSLPGPVRIVFVGWVLGCAVSLTSLAAGALRLRTLVRTARPLRDPDWLRQAASTAGRIGIRRNVRLLSSATVATPMTGGLWKPVILLPESALEWSPTQRDVVLAHELVHVRRRDGLRQLMRRVVLALYWFHPLGWLAARRADLASEEACDEEVLALGARPSQYARLLFLLASAHGRRRNVLALPIVRPSQLERRIVSILRRQPPRSSVARTAVTVAVVGVAGLSTAAVRPMQPAPLARQAMECRSAASDSIRSMISSRRVWVTGREDEDRILETAVWGIYLCMRTHGSVVLNDAGTEVLAMGADSRLLLESAFEKTHRLLVTEGPTGIEHEWSVDGVRQTFDDEARQWQNQVLAVLHGYLEVDGIRAEHAGLREINSARRRISAHWGHHGALRDRISIHRRHIGSLRGRLSSYRGRLSPLEDVMRWARTAEAREALGAEVGELRERIRQIEDEIAAYDLEGKIRELERQIEDYDVDGKVAAIQAEIDRMTERLDADGRAARGRVEEIRRSLADEMMELHVLNW